MKLSHEDLGQLSVITLKGEFTGDHVDHFRRAVDERIGKQVRDFVVNMAEVEFLDSAALEALLKLQETCADLLGQVRVAGVKGNVEQILRITRLTPRFDLHETVESAVKSLRI